MGFDLSAGELEEQVGESVVVVETGSASQWVHVEWRSGSDVRPYLELSRLGRPRGVGAMTDEQREMLAGSDDVCLLRWMEKLMNIGSCNLSVVVV